MGLIRIWPYLGSERLRKVVIVERPWNNATNLTAGPRVLLFLGISCPPVAVGSVGPAELGPAGG